MFQLQMLLLLGLLVAVHEAGHYAASRLAGLPVAAFSIGFGPKLWARHRWGTEFAVRAVPLGGFVQPAEPENFPLRPLGHRLLFFLGGPLANLLVALPLLVVAHGRAGDEAVRHLPTGLSAQTLQGVVGVLVEGGSLLEAGYLLEVTIVLSLSLALLNLLPVPVLDGGQILLALAEAAWPRLQLLRPGLTLAGGVFLAVVTVGLAVVDSRRLWVG